MDAASRWTDALSQWAIPEAILAQAAESPWTLPPRFFAESAQRSLSTPLSPTHLHALAALPAGGELLDVGAGGGAASLPLSDRVSRIVAVDQSPEMLDQMAQLAKGRAEVIAVEGSWPQVANLVGPADVVVCANVAYNVAALDQFVTALTERARRRVVLELTASHPQASISWLWKHFWDLDRPEGPTASDAAMVIQETVGGEVGRETWVGRPPLTADVEPETVAWIRRRLCLSPRADAELSEVLRAGPPGSPVQMVTLWWPGSA